MACKLRTAERKLPDEENLGVTGKIKQEGQKGRRQPLADLDGRNISNRGGGPDVVNPMRKPELKDDDPGEGYTGKQLADMDPDEDDANNDPHMVSDYVNEVFAYLRQLEMQQPIRRNFLDGHETTVKQRSVLLNWLVEVHSDFKLSLDTLYLCVSVLDRYLQGDKTVSKTTLQLVGVTAMIIASKYEDIDAPHIQDFVYVCDKAFAKKEVIKMELQILKALDFKLGKAGSIHFLRRYNKIARVTGKHHNLGKYLLELALLEYKFAHEAPSMVAAAVCVLSIAIIDNVKKLRPIWTPALQTCSSYRYVDIKRIINNVITLVRFASNSKYRAVKQKYALSRNEGISMSHILFRVEQLII
ncbi:G2/mitotic-specific cyclin-B-like [Aethina tumida]|uniref:G2/mitotic-specific cyclin-B-like n=1 Tax=Aethina tumida TaxID=116153 RepID=UPI00096AE12B|nr:G2/mitotic-specific cyclin-B-like [Aethina tumida]